MKPISSPSSSLAATAPGVALLAAALAVALPAPAAAAECYFRYDEGFRATCKRVFHVTPPSKAGSFSSMADCQATLRAMLSDPQYRGDAGLGRTRCECYDDGDGAPAVGGPALGGSVKAQFVSKLLGALIQGLTAPPGPSGDEIRAKLQKQWDDEEAARRIAEKRREEAAFRRAHQTASALLGGRPGEDGGPAPAGGDASVVYLGAGTVPALLRSAGAVTEAQWAEARARQARIDALRARVPRSAAEDRELAALEGRRNALWSRAVSVPGLTQRDRDALRLELHVDDTSGAVASTDRLLDLREEAPTDAAHTPAHPLTTLVEASVTTGVRSAAEAWGEGRAERVGEVFVGEGKRLFKFGDALAIGGVGKAVVEGKPEESAEFGISWALGKVVERAPGLGLGVGTAQGVAAVTTTMARRSIERLVEETDKVVPGLLAPGESGEAWWKARKEELSLPQRFVVEGIGM